MSMIKENMVNMDKKVEDVTQVTKEVIFSVIGDIVCVENITMPVPTSEVGTENENKEFLKILAETINYYRTMYDSAMVVFGNSVYDVKNIVRCRLYDPSRKN